MREHDLDRDPPSADLLAGEYVLGVLDAHARREARLRASHDPAFARLIDDWARRLEPLHDELPKDAVPTHVWPRIRTRLGWASIERASTPRVGLWKAATAAGFATAAALAVVMLQVPRSTPPSTPVAATPKAVTPMPEMPVTRLVKNDGQLAYLATVDMHGGGMWLVPVPGAMDEDGMAPVLWLIAPGQKPKALGYVGAWKSHWVDVPKAELHAGMTSKWTIAITMEPVQPVAPQVPSSKPMAAGTLSL
ncbi:anti-sigma factor [Lysobacter sp. TY2-98]|uniref:anti-sigma factor n=1 Tax=Lysobacter sp. TY2-98 TaxID=2290922 RepID=UPI0013B44F5E|nr:anti-sigma factor [Lysobacter sp. TY2-98]